MNRALSALALAAIVAVAVDPSLFSAANAGPGYSTYRDRLGFGNVTSNGPQLIGGALGDALVVHALILPSGEAVALR